MQCDAMYIESDQSARGLGCGVYVLSILKEIPCSAILRASSAGPILSSVARPEQGPACGRHEWLRRPKRKPTTADPRQPAECYHAKRSCQLIRPKPKSEADGVVCSHGLRWAVGSINGCGMSGPRSLSAEMDSKEDRGAFSEEEMLRSQKPVASP